MCRELTKVHEEVVRGPRTSWRSATRTSRPRGEVALVIGAAPDAARDLGPALDAVKRLVEAGAKPRPAAAVVAELTGTSANALYRGLTAPPQ